MNEKKSMKNPHCDNVHCTRPDGEVRTLPVGTDGNALLCRTCFNLEIHFRRERNQHLEDSCKFPLPLWDALSIYWQPAPPRPLYVQSCELSALAFELETMIAALGVYAARVDATPEGRDNLTKNARAQARKIAGAASEIINALRP